MNTTKLPKENDVGLDKAHVIGRFFYTDVFKDDIIVVTKTDGKGYYGFSIKDGRLASLAQTSYEEAAMWAVKVATA